MADFEKIQIGSQNWDEPMIIDAKGSQCPGPVMALKDGFTGVPIGKQITIEVTDPGFISDA